MPQIIPIRDLKNTTEISNLCHNTTEPIYISKNGYGDMVIMSIEEAIRKRISEIVDTNKTTLTALCLNSNLTPSTIFDFMSGKSKCPKVITIKKICSGANITLEEFFARDYFNKTEDIY